MNRLLLLATGMLLLLALTADAQSIEPSSSDLWDVTQDVTITSTSGFLGYAGSDYGLFGQNGQDFYADPTYTYFSDSQPPGFVHYVEWSTLNPVTIEEVRLFAVGDGPEYGNEREFAQFTLKTKSPGSIDYNVTILTYTPTHPYTFSDPSTYALLDETVPSITGREFRAEFVQFNGGRGFDGPRIRELDAFGIAPPSVPTIQSQPVNQEVNVGTAVSFNVAASGSGDTQYQWRHNGVDIPGATSNVLRIENVRQTDGGEYVVAVSNEVGETLSEPAQLSINLTSILPSSFDLWDVSNGSTITATSGFLWAGTPEGMFGLNGQDKFNGDAYTYFLDGQPDGFTHFVEWTTPTPVTINAIRLFAVGDGPDYNNEREFTTFTLKTKSPGSSEFDHVVASFSPTHPYQILDPSTWALLDMTVPTTTAQEFRAEFVQFNGFRGFDGPRIMELDAFTGIPEITPFILTQPAGRSVVHNSQLTLEVQAAGGNLHYQWQFNGVNIPGANQAALTINKVKPKDAGSYSVVVNNSIDTVTSSPAQITVQPGKPLQ